MLNIVTVAVCLNSNSEWADSLVIHIQKEIWIVWNLFHSPVYKAHIDYMNTICKSEIKNPHEKSLEAACSIAGGSSPV